MGTYVEVACFSMGMMTNEARHAKYAEILVTCANVNVG